MSFSRAIKGGRSTNPDHPRGPTFRAGENRWMLGSSTFTVRDRCGSSLAGLGHIAGVINPSSDQGKPKTQIFDRPRPTAPTIGALARPKEGGGSFHGLVVWWARDLGVRVAEPRKGADTKFRRRRFTPAAGRIQRPISMTAAGELRDKSRG